MNQYEAMFLFDPTFGGASADCEAEIRRLMGRAGAEIVLLSRWDERRLAYRIRGRKRGVYVLVYFKANPDRIKGLERDALLSENVLRLLVLRADGVTREMMEKAVSGRASVEEAGGAPKPAEAPAATEAQSQGPRDAATTEEESVPEKFDVLVGEVPADEEATESA
ncbi:MAG: 30S ribosomal protein S6 [Phycisphaerae bacterium]